MEVTETRERNHHADGTFSDYAIFKIPQDGLRFVDINQSGEQGKLKDISHMAYVRAQERGVASPVIVSYALLHPDQPVEKVFPGLLHETEEGERLLSANSFINYTMRILFKRGWVRHKEGRWEAACPDVGWKHRVSAVMEFMVQHDRLWLETTQSADLDFAEVEMAVEQDLLGVGACGFLSDFAVREQPLLVFNSAFFILEHDDASHFHSVFCEAHGFWMQDGIIMRPPLFRRGAIWQHGNGKWNAGLLGLDDLNLLLPNGLRLVHWRQPLMFSDLSYALNSDGTAPVVLYTRYFGVAGQEGGVIGSTPTQEGCFELTVIDRRVVGWKFGGGLTIPHNGIVISFGSDVLQPAVLDELQSLLCRRFELTYAFATQAHRGLRQGIQAGPMLLENGECPLTDGYLETWEQFWPELVFGDGSRRWGVLPTKYETDVDRTRAGRVGVGMDREGGLVVVLAPGVNAGADIPGKDSYGATLSELADLLRKAGALTAVNLDGGGSAQAIFRGKQVLRPGDRRGMPGKVFERMVPSVGMVPGHAASPSV